MPDVWLLSLSYAWLLYYVWLLYWDILPIKWVLLSGHLIRVNMVQYSLRASRVAYFLSVNILDQVFVDIIKLVYFPHRLIIPILRSFLILVLPLLILLFHINWLYNFVLYTTKHLKYPRVLDPFLIVYKKSNNISLLNTEYINRCMINNFIITIKFILIIDDLFNKENNKLIVSFLILNLNKVIQLGKLPLFSTSFLLLY